MNMLFNTEKPRFDSHLQSAPPAPAARCGCVRVAGARNTAARERRLGAVISISAAPVARMRRGGPRAAGQSVSEGARAGCCGSGAPLGTQSCAAGAHATTADRLPTRTFLLLNPAFVPYYSGVQIG